LADKETKLTDDTLPEDNVPASEKINEKDPETGKKEPISDGKKQKQDKKKSGLENEIQKLKEEKKDLEDKNLRLMAEFDNFRKRSQREKENIYPDAVADTVKKLLPVMDNFERALESPCSDESFGKGVDMIYKSLLDLFAELGVETIGKVGETFDPNIHNAVMHLDDENLEKNVVAAVFQKGYRMGDRIIRYAMVQQAN